MTAGVLLFVAAIAMLWIRPPHAAEQSPIIPLSLSGSRLHRVGRTA